MASFALCQEDVLETRIHRFVVGENRHLRERANELADDSRTLCNNQWCSSFENVDTSTDPDFGGSERFFDC